MVVSRRGASSRAPRGVSEFPNRPASWSATASPRWRSCRRASVDLVFADPPYNLQLASDLKRPDDSLSTPSTTTGTSSRASPPMTISPNAGSAPASGVMKPAGTLWVIGSYHNIFRVGTILQDLGFWILNDVIWRKTNPMPNFRGRRFTNAHETLIWASRDPPPRATPSITRRSKPATKTSRCARTGPSRCAPARNGSRAPTARSCIRRRSRKRCSRA